MQSLAALPGLPLALSPIPPAGSGSGRTARSRGHVGAGDRVRARPILQGGPPKQTTASGSHGSPAGDHQPAPGLRSGLCTAILLPSGRRPGNGNPAWGPPQSARWPGTSHAAKSQDPALSRILTGPVATPLRSIRIRREAERCPPARPCQFRVPSGGDRKGGQRIRK